jgi:hypothetical protein
MTSDFENDEIKDTAFPVDFTDDGATLDMYGVWVKNGPRDAPAPEQPHNEEPSAVEQMTIDEIVPEEISTNEQISIETFSELPDLPDFTFDDSAGRATEQYEESLAKESDWESPVFTESSMTQETSEDFTIGEIRFEEIENESLGVVEPLIPAAEAHEEAIFSKKEMTAADFNSVDASEFMDDFGITVDAEESTLAEPEAESLSAEIWDEKITFEEIRSDELSGRIVQTRAAPVAQEKAHQVRTEEKPVSISDFEDIPLEFLDTMETFIPPTIESREITEFADVESISSDLEPIAEIPAEPIMPFDEVLPETAMPDEPENALPEDDFAGINIPADDDFSSFLDDLNSGGLPEQSRPASSSENIDLDSFIDSFNESGGVSHENTAELYDDIDPVDLELEFDESFIEDAEKIRATGARVSESEFFNSEFGVELIDETSEVSGTPDIDDELADFAASIETLDTPDSAVAKSDSYADAFESASEFDDLLQSLDLAPAPAQAKPEQTAVQAAKPRSFDLVVTDEDEMGSIQTSVMETATSDDIDIPLFGSLPQENVTVRAVPSEPVVAAAQENLDIPVIRDYNDTESGHDTDHAVSSVVEENMAPDFDDISAVEQELNDLTPDTGDETVVTNDKSTELLMIIADELSSIKQELTTLKSELSTFKAAGLTAEPGVASETLAPNDNSGFFSDDDTDETIALTGDELNNILITADFTEEKSEAEEISIDAAIAPVAEDPVENLVADTPIIEPAASESISFEDTIEEEIPETLPDSIFEIPQLDVAAPIEVSHVTTIEDDVSYLEGSEAVEPELDNVAIEEPDLETIDFDDEKLEEPELTEFNIDLSDISADLSAGQEVPVPASEEPISFEEPSLSAIDTESLNIDFAESLTAEAPIIEETAFEKSVAEEFLSEEPVLEAAVGESAEEPSDQDISGGAEAAPVAALPVDLKNEIKSVLSYMDQLLESLPEEKIEEFARSDQFEVYKKLFEELGIS